MGYKLEPAVGLQIMIIDFHTHIFPLATTLTAGEENPPKDWTVRDWCSWCFRCCKDRFPEMPGCSTGRVGCCRCALRMPNRAISIFSERAGRLSTMWELRWETANSYMPAHGAHQQPESRRSRFPRKNGEPIPGRENSFRLSDGDAITREECRPVTC